MAVQCETEMNRSLTTSMNSINAGTASSAILRAWRFVDNVGNQVETLRGVLTAQLEEPPGLKDGPVPLRISPMTGKDEKYGESEWVWREWIGTYEMYDTSRRGKPVPVIYAGFQISLAPSRPIADDQFYPNLAVLLAGAKDDEEWGQWELGDFEFDDELMTSAELQEDGQPPWWKRSDNRQWEAASKDDPAVALIVPLVELTNEQDVKNKVIIPFIEMAKRLLARSDR